MLLIIKNSVNEKRIKFTFVTDPEVAPEIV